MKNKAQFVFAIILFVISNTAYFWQSKLGVYFLFVSAGLILSYLLLFFFILRIIFFSIKHKINDKYYLLYLLFLSFVLICPIVFPGGIINFEKYESENSIIAQREGVANCINTLKIKVDGRFVERAVCFGITEYSGKYKQFGDTLFFEYDDKLKTDLKRFEYAIIKRKVSTENIGTLTKYIGKKDTIGIVYTIIK